MFGFRKKFYEKGGGVELGYNLSFRYVYMLCVDKLMIVNIIFC